MPPSQSHRPSGDDEEHLVGDGSHRLVEVAEGIAPRPTDIGLGMHAHPDLLGHDDARSRPRPQRFDQGAGVDHEVGVCGHPGAERVDEDRLRRASGERADLSSLLPLTARDDS